MTKQRSDEDYGRGEVPPVPARAHTHDRTPELHKITIGRERELGRQEKKKRILKPEKYIYIQYIMYIYKVYKH